MLPIRTRCGYSNRLGALAKYPGRRDRRPEFFEWLSVLPGDCEKELAEETPHPGTSINAQMLAAQKRIRRIELCRKTEE